MDGVFDMQPYYATGGFEFSHRNMRFRLNGLAGATTAKNANIAPLHEVGFDQVKAYDRTCFPAARNAFLGRWIAMPNAQALGYVRDGALCGYGVIRRCGEGCKIGPLFADDAEIAEALFTQLLPFAAGGPVFLDAPEDNENAMALVQRHGMEEVFGCARMYLGPVPDIAHDKTFGVTTFELG